MVHCKNCSCYKYLDVTITIPLFNFVLSRIYIVVLVVAFLSSRMTPSSVVGIRLFWLSSHPTKFQSIAKLLSSQKKPDKLTIINYL